jgi:hypothetical protein
MLPRERRGSSRASRFPATARGWLRASRTVVDLACQPGTKVSCRFASPSPDSHPVRRGGAATLLQRCWCAISARGPAALAASSCLPVRAGPESVSLASAVWEVVLVGFAVEAVRLLPLQASLRWSHDLPVHEQRCPAMLVACVLGSLKPRPPAFCSCDVGMVLGSMSFHRSRWCQYPPEVFPGQQPDPFARPKSPSGLVPPRRWRPFPARSVSSLVPVTSTSRPFSTGQSVASARCYPSQAPDPLLGFCAPPSTLTSLVSSSRSRRACLAPSTSR